MKSPLLFVFAILLSLQNIPIAVSKPNSNLNLNPNAAQSTSTSASRRKLVIGVDGGTESIRACCFDAATGEVVGKSCAVPYTTFHPQPGWAEQHPTDWYQNLCEAVRGALKSLDDEENEESGESSILVCTKDDVTAICVDTTCCSVVALDDKCEPLRPALLWMDARSAPQTVEIMDKCKGDPALSVNCNGDGPISAEWMTPKALWIKQNEPNVWKHALHICEYQDYINYRLTGVMCASSCNAAVRWHWDGEECIKNNNSSSSTTSDNSGNSKKNDKYRGRPMSLYTKLGMPELADKLPEKCLSMGSLVGHLTKEAASHLGLNEGLPVAQGGPDAFVGMVGLGCVYPQQLCLITGSSHLHCVVTSKPTTATGTWG
jgi:ribulose kinase